jgi:serine/threonine-protein kinase
MSSPLPSGTLLQNRYRLDHLLAEGGFARTYLAEDSGRFGERCLLKEFCPSQSQPEFFQKAQELFQREAQTLYQLDHPQVPKFRALFTEVLAETQRLFLVQDYIEGKTYRLLLQERMQTGKVFSEFEIRQFLARLLPVLAYIHHQGIIHRDLSLDNLMQRQSDQYPVLIDFGVVKTVITKLQQSQLMPMGTIVGTMGFAPAEQLQSGQAYPSSDLYALAVCCLVLLSGKEPVQLFAADAATWAWRSHTSVSDDFANLLDRMLAHRPSDRFSSAEEVLGALNVLPEIVLAPPPEELQNALARPVPESTSDTLIAHPPATPLPQTQQRPENGLAAKASPAPVIAQPRQRRQNNNQLWIPILIFFSLLAAGAGWLATQLLLQNRWLQRNEQQQSAASASPSLSISPKVSPNLTYSETLDLSGGQSITVRGEVQPNEMQTYQFTAEKGDRFSIQSNSAVKISLLTSNLSPLEIASQSPNTWSTILPKSDTYTLRVLNESTTRKPYQMLLALAPGEPPEPPAAEQLSPSPEASPAPLQTFQTQTLPPNPERQQWSGELVPGQIQRYVIPVSSGSALFANVLADSPVTLTVRDPAGQVLANAQNVLNWEALVVKEGNYEIDVVPVDPSAPASFSVDLGTRPS